jgi:UDP-N-acetylmuramoyl-L-alanyl-D-glutamate--2,6-diaminopimelate ligase
MNRAVPFTLGRLLAGFAAVPAQWADQLVSGLSADSRTVQAGDLFFARRGGQRHGLEFLEAARAVRAAAVVWEPPDDGWLPVGDSDLPLLAAPALGRNLGCIASRFYGEPSRQLAVVGITGTDGKTSCAHFIAQALSDAATGPCGLLGTLGGGVYGQTEPSLHTTPDPLAVQRWLAWIDRYRSALCGDGSFFSCAGSGPGERCGLRRRGVDQLSRDHLDYHGTV